MTMTEAELSVIEARVNAASPGPWYPITTDDELFQGAVYVSVEQRGRLGEGLLLDTGEVIGAGLYRDQGRRKVRLRPGGVDPGKTVAINTLQSPPLAELEEHSENAIFIAHAREDVPALIAEVRRLRGLLEEIGVAPVSHLETEKTPVTGGLF
ncbi:hypothetical protein [uncultured Deinococcus sp.]|uniref:hypothetical protein n=1 Tax=uncultured Deinococcus sp. TaxID=158789 RepID=UPI0025F27CCE|nr:hypothetical protein [uncultured Deinococcus sp.]